MFVYILFYFIIHNKADVINGKIDESGTFNLRFKASNAQEKPPIYYAGVINPDEYIANNSDIPLSEQCLFNVNVSTDYIDSTVNVFLKEHNMSFGIMNIQQQDEYDELKIYFKFDGKAARQHFCWPRKTNAIE